MNGELPKVLNSGQLEEILPIFSVEYIYASGTLTHEGYSEQAMYGYVMCLQHVRELLAGVTQGLQQDEHDSNYYSNGEVTMCFSSRPKIPKVQPQAIVPPPAPLLEDPAGIRFGGGDEDYEREEEDRPWSNLDDKDEDDKDEDRNKPTLERPDVVKQSTRRSIRRPQMVDYEYST